MQGTESAPLVYCLTLNWRRPAETVACLGSLAAQSYANLRLLVVDNGSGDGSVEVIRAACPAAEMIASATNLGFAGGANLGLRHALEQGADLVFLVNNDTRVAPDTLSELVRRLDDSVGILAPLIYYAQPPDLVWSAGGRVHPWTLETVGDVRGQRDRGQWRTPMERDFVTGCAMLLTRRLLETVGLFDERFFLYYEDSDLCRRARLAGWRILVVPTAKVWHSVARSSGGSDSPDERYWMARSSVTFFRKHARGAQWLAIAPWRAASAIRTSLRLLSAGNRAACAAYWRGLRDGCR